MKIKRAPMLIIVFLIVSTILTGCLGNISTVDEVRQQSSTPSLAELSTLITNDYNGLDIEKLNNYYIDLEFNPETKSYRANQTVEYINNEDTQLHELYFHIYPNAFREEKTAPFLFDSFNSAFPQGYEPGYIDFSKITVSGKDVEYTISGEGNTILKVPFQEALDIGEKIDIYMEYEVVLPPAQDRFGYGEKTYNLGNWYPIAAVYDEDGWNLDPYYSIGDPFYSDTSNYDVTIKAPKDIVIASSGNILSEDIEGEHKIWNIEAKLMRDFAWVASEHFIKKEKEVDGTLVKVYLLEDNNINSFVEDVSYSSIEIFNEAFGKYPYGQYSVVATSFPSGMEYPGIVFIGEKYYNNLTKGYLEIVIAHETAHQWWYGVVGNDEIDEAWLDESITTYSEVVYTQGKYDKETAESYYKNNIERSYSMSSNNLDESNEVVVKPLSEFNDWSDYGPLAYNKGAMFINAIKEKYGEEKVYEILRTYYSKYKFLNAKTEDFIRVCEEVTGDDFTKLSNTWLYNK